MLSGHLKVFCSFFKIRPAPFSIAVWKKSRKKNDTFLTIVTLFLKTFSRIFARKPLLFDPPKKALFFCSRSYLQGVLPKRRKVTIFESDKKKIKTDLRYTKTLVKKVEKVKRSDLTFHFFTKKRPFDPQFGLAFTRKKRGRRSGKKHLFEIWKTSKCVYRKTLVNRKN